MGEQEYIRLEAELVGGRLLGTVTDERDDELTEAMGDLWWELTDEQRKSAEERAKRYNEFQDARDQLTRAERAEADLDAALLAMRKFAELESERISLASWAESCSDNDVPSFSADEARRLWIVTKQCAVMLNDLKVGDIEAALKAMGVEQAEEGK